MDNKDILEMDPYILLSIINMKLRDEFDSLDSLCLYYDIKVEKIDNRLKDVGYRYNKTNNQFVSID